MKRLITFICVMMIITGISYSQSIKITSPSGKIWFKGKTYDITWSSTGRIDNSVKIRLFSRDGRQKLIDITNGTPNNGSFSWTIPSAFTSGYYTIRVKTLDNKVSGNSVKFKISGKLSYHGKGLAYKPGKSTVKNTKTPVVTRTPPALPDMIISSIKNLRITRGKHTKNPRKYDYLRVQVKNNSNMDAQFFPGGEIIRASSGLNILDYYKGGKKGSSPKTGSQYITFRPGGTRTVDFIIDSKDPRERIPVTVKVDPNNIVRESNERNNTQNLIYLKKPKKKKKKADLIIETISSNGPFTRRGFFIMVRIKNIGDKTASPIGHYSNILSINGSAKNVTLWNTKFKPMEKVIKLSPGKTNDLNVWILPTIWEGQLTLSIKVDPDNVVAESSETNNTKTLVTKIVRAERSR